MDDSERALLATVADLYYNEKLSQDEIANKLYFSRSKVSRLLQRSVDTGVVEIHINFPYVCIPELEEQICQRYSLKSCSVLRTSFAQILNDDSFDRLTRFAAHSIETLLKPGMRIGISSGQTVTAVSKQITGRSGLDLKFVQVKGMANADGRYDYDSPTAIHILAEKFESSFSQLYAPLYVKNEIARRYLLNEPLIANVMTEARKADLVIASVAPLDSKYNIWADFLSHDDIKVLQDKGAVCSMMGHFFDRKGRIADQKIEEETVSLSLQDIRKLKHLLLVVSGVHKAKALSAVLFSTCVSSLIIDEKLAEALLRV